MLRFDYPKWREAGSPPLGVHVRFCKGCGKQVFARCEKSTGMQINKGCGCTTAAENWVGMSENAWVEAWSKESREYLIDVDTSPKVEALLSEYKIAVVFKPTHKDDPKPYRASVTSADFDYHAEAASASEALLLVAAHWHSHKNS